ncbi:hypothetical protein FB45DRAFT_864471 [Roridomyces roridus]|uniref:Uncharacterized protein n=1 Tax=Roridomyces roridus TaxID=1738132 RepID=A0AAD7FPX0_9AGAR|nr:hypothetical protein FB45DRAFT_864471 [Roridomyces roridus]
MDQAQILAGHEKIVYITFIADSTIACGQKNLGLGTVAVSYGHTYVRYVSRPVPLSGHDERAGSVRMRLASVSIRTVYGSTAVYGRVADKCGPLLFAEPRAVPGHRQAIAKVAIIDAPLHPPSLSCRQPALSHRDMRLGLPRKSTPGWFRGRGRLSSHSMTFPDALKTFERRSQTIRIAPSVFCTRTVYASSELRVRFLYCQFQYLDTSTELEPADLLGTKNVSLCPSMLVPSPESNRVPAAAQQAEAFSSLQIHNVPAFLWIHNQFDIILALMTALAGCRISPASHLRAAFDGMGKGSEGSTMTSELSTLVVGRDGRDRHPVGVSGAVSRPASDKSTPTRKPHAALHNATKAACEIAQPV